MFDLLGLAEVEQKSPYYTRLTDDKVCRCYDQQPVRYNSTLHFAVHFAYCSTLFLKIRSIIEIKNNESTQEYEQLHNHQ